MELSHSHRPQQPTQQLLLLPQQQVLLLPQQQVLLLPQQQVLLLPAVQVQQGRKRRTWQQRLQLHFRR
jgi:hypothetical protein